QNLHAQAAKTQAVTVRPVPIQPHPTATFQRAGNQAINRMLGSHTIQAKLVIAPPADRHEGEADSAAEAVLRMPAGGPSLAPTLSRVSAAAVQRKCDECEEEQLEGKPARDASLPEHRGGREEEEKIQRRASGAVPAKEIGPSVENSIEAERGG